MSATSKIKLPGKAYNPDGDDLGQPIQELLVELHVLEKDGDEADLGPFKGTPYSVQVITAGATSLGKVWSAVIALLGGGGAIAAGLKGLGYSSDEPILASTFTASAAVLLAAVAISIALLVRADVSARAIASAAQYNARAAITSSLLGTARYNVPVPPNPASNYMVEVADKWFPVKEFRQTADGVVADLVGRDDAVPIANVKGILPKSAWDTK